MLESQRIPDKHKETGPKGAFHNLLLAFWVTYDCVSGYEGTDPKKNEYLEVLEPARTSLPPSIMDILVEPSTSSAGSEFSENDEKDIEPSPETSSKEYYGALLADDYGDDPNDGEYKTAEEKAARLKEFQEQEAEGFFADEHPDIVVEKKSLDQDQLDPGEEGSASTAWDLTIKSLLQIPMPMEFNYTVAVMANEVFQGLLHTFLRHSSQWSKVILDFFGAVRNIAAIKKDLYLIGASKNSNQAYKSLQQFQQKIITEDLEKSLSDGDKIALGHLQMEIYRFILNQTSYSNYLGEGLNSEGKLQVFFNVEDIQGRSLVMVICVSDEKYRAAPKDTDPRGVRTITTIFFISKQKAAKKLVGKMF